ncbi:uncharacterized protein [Spinacia oleracea]|uniref:GRF-type domain-containing protein n=1 Tax=Spinacia oleracea TaxID=3562 RepID=A0A9R0J958_SPIOL|nr:uncharacterized protein LOC110802609 [Spinacia oleracea]
MASGSKSSGKQSSINSQRANHRLICYCNDVAVLRTAKNGVNAGKKFYGCPNWPVAGACKFFEWLMDDGVVNRPQLFDDYQLKILEKDTEIAELEMKNKMLEEKVKRLQIKKENVEEENQEMKNELCHMRFELMNCSRTEKNLSMILIFSWLMFAVLALLLR